VPVFIEYLISELPQKGQGFILHPPKFFYNIIQYNKNDFHVFKEKEGIYFNAFKKLIFGLY
jgi:hypothetical protein